MNTCCDTTAETTKPVRSGPLVYAVSFHPYQDAKSGNTTRATYKAWGFGETVVLMVDFYMLYRKTFAIEFSGTIFFPSFCLLKCLASNNIRALGRVRENRLGHCIITQKK